MRREGGRSLHRALPFYDLLVVIPSNVKNVEKRQGIRDSWAKYLDAAGRCARCSSARTVKIVFGIGQASEPDATSLAFEQQAFGDVAVLEVPPGQDFYRNLATKVQSCIAFAVRNFRFGLLLKVDTDSFVFMDRLLPLLESQQLFQKDGEEGPGIYGGAFQSNARPDETPGGKWADRTYRLMTGHDLFPKYARGAGYLLSPSLCRYIAGILEAQPDSEDTWAGLPHLQALPNEDVSVGFWLEPVVHRKVELAIAHLPTGCRNKTQVIDHHVMPKLMALRWSTLESQGDPCSAQHVLQEEVFEQLLATKLDALNYSGLS